MRRAVRLFLTRVAGVFRPGASRRDIEDELGFHVNEEIDERVESGQAAPAARRDAQRSLGNATLIAEDVRAVRRWTLFESVAQDIRHGLRGLRRAPAFTLAAVLTFALGIGSATAMFSVVDAVLLEPLKFRDSDDLVRLSTTIAPAGGSAPRTLRASITVAELLELRAHSRTVAGAAVYVTDFKTLTGAETTARLEGWRVEPTLFELLGVSPLMGRTLAAGDTDAVVLGERTWRDQFGGARDVIGRSIRLDGASYVVVGVMPAVFQFPLELPNWQYWVPLRLYTDSPDELRVRLPMVARLADDTTPESAAAEITTLLRPTSVADRTYELVRLQDEIVRPVRRALLVLMPGVVCVLLIACVNVASLLLARTTVRQEEIVVRLALGASGARVVRQLVTESVMLALAGAAAGLVVATAAIELIHPLGVTLARMDVGRLASFPRLDEIGVDRSVALIACATAVLAGVALGMLTAMRAVGVQSHASLRAKGAAARSESGWGSLVSLRSLLVTAEIALAMVLLVGSGLLLKSFVKLATVPLGYEPGHVLTFQVATPAGRYDGDRIQTFAEDFVTRLSTLPDVESAAYAPLLPMVTLLYDTARFRRTAQLTDTPREPAEDFRPVSQTYFETMGIRIVAGRGFSDDDRAGQPKVVVINRALARRDFPDENPVGQSVYLLKDTQPWRVVGVAEDVRQRTLDQDPSPQVFISLRQSPMAAGMRFLQYYAVRTSGDPLAVVPRVRDTLRSLEPEAGLYHAAPMAQLVTNAVSRPRLYAVLATAGSTIALVLAAVGVYGVMAYFVTARTRELGIRMALGASRLDVCRLVAGRGLMQAGVGMTLGLLGAAAAVRSLDGLLFGLVPLDPATFAASIAVFTIVAVVACAIPALRATRIHPAAALRAE